MYVSWYVFKQGVTVKGEIKATVHKVLQVPMSVNDLLRVRRRLWKRFSCVQFISNIRLRFGKKKEACRTTRIHVQGFSAATWATETPAGVQYVASFLDSREGEGISTVSSGVTIRHESSRDFAVRERSVTKA